MAGIYIHIPFCRQACHYCNFHFSTSLGSKNDFIAALLKEIVLQKDYLAQEPVDTVYFGGGTPSLLSVAEIDVLLHALAASFNISREAEITLEANPDDLNTGKLQELREAGINRLSIGIQSFFEDDLRWMNRAHNARQSIACIYDALSAGFTNLTIDLIYGTPGLTDDKWKENVQKAIDFNIPHLSCYALTVEPKTALDHFITTKQYLPVDADQQARQFLLLMDWTAAAGYEHYEISNFAKPGMRSKHNTAYWLGKKYLGLGPSAHSFNGISRQWNIANNALYVQSLQQQQLPFEKEELTVTHQLNEYIMTSLRTIEGLSIGYVTEKFGETVAQTIFRSSGKFIQAGNMQWDGERLRLTRQGKLLADGIAAELFF
ncbi:MAG TPA: radical SAM family heme chaperone HemW [Chitinophagaceae bacterium]|nr:radical SAM family heme chaperone HemW [Chitinophagaceae bacterium]